MNIMVSVPCWKCQGNMKIYVPGCNTDEGGAFLHLLNMALLLDDTDNLIVKDNLVESKLSVKGVIQSRTTIEHDKSLANLLAAIKREMDRQRRETEFERAHELEQLQKYMGGPWRTNDVS